MTHWYNDPKVRKALNSKKLAIVYIKADGDDTYRPMVANTAPYRVIRKAYTEYDRAARIACGCGVEWGRVTERLGLRVLPDMLVAAKIGCPYEWTASPLYDKAVAALAQIEGDK